MTEEQRDNLLINMSENIKTINNVLEVHSKEFEKIYTILGEHSKILNEHTKILNEHSKTLKEHSKLLQEHSNKFVELRQNMVRMEYELTDKITALFDLGEVNKDKFEETDLRIKEIENTLDWHDRRLMKLEMAD